MNKKYLISAVIALASILVVSKYFQNKNLNNQILTKKLKPVSKIVVGKVYSLNGPAATDKQEYLKLVDQTHWIMVKKDLTSSLMKYPTIKIIEGTYQHVGKEYLFDKKTKELTIAFANKDNALKNIYFASELQMNYQFYNPGIHFANKKYMCNDKNMYLVQEKLPDSIAQYLKRAEYNPAVPTNMSRCAKG